MNIGKKIKQLRLEQGLKQSDLAEKAKISRVTLGNYERGERDPHLINLRKIANALDISISELIYDDIEKKEIKSLQNIFEKISNDEPFNILENKNFNQSIEILKLLKDKIENKELKDFFTNYLDKIPSSTILNKDNTSKIDMIYNQEINPLINKLVDTLELEIYKLMNQK